MAASPNNSLCAVGIAYNAQIGGIRMLDGQGKKFIQKKNLEFIEEKKNLATIHVEIYQLDRRIVVIHHHHLHSGLNCEKSAIYGSHTICLKG